MSPSHVEPDPPQQSPVRGQLWPEWIAFILLALLVAATITLALYTTNIYKRTNAIRTEMATVISPALEALEDLIISVSLEVGKMLEYALAARPTELADIRRHGVASREALTRLEPLANALSAETRRNYQQLTRSMRRWETEGPELMNGAARGPSDFSPDQLEALYRAVLLDATAVQRSLLHDWAHSRTRIDAAEALDLYFTLGLVALALAAAVLIVGLFRRVRVLAEVAEHRRSEAVAAMTDRARLIRGITHDVKNPLGVADGTAELLEMGIGGDLAPEQRESVDRIRRSIHGALSIVEDLLELSRAEAGQLQLKLAPTDLRRVLAEVARDHHASMQAAGLSMEEDLAQEIPTIVTDVDKVREIIGNLLSNAMKFTPPGGHVTLTLKSRDRDRPTIDISVADTGPGVSIDEQDRIFEEFYRTNGSFPHHAGSGLGLAISRRLARLLGGNLTIESEPGHGAVFTLSLPVVEHTVASPGHAAVQP